MILILITILTFEVQERFEINFSNIVTIGFKQTFEQI